MVGVEEGEEEVEEGEGAMISVISGAPMKFSEG